MNIKANDIREIAENVVVLPCFVVMATNNKINMTRVYL